MEGRFRDNDELRFSLRALPTLDSGHIESYIHHIPNLSEHYFYFNDDVFFGAPVKLEDWTRRNYRATRLRFAPLRTPPV